MPNRQFTSSSGVVFQVGQEASEVAALRCALEAHGPDVFVELGTWRGGVPAVVRDTLPGIQVHSHDMSPPTLTAEQMTFLGPMTHFHQTDILGAPRSIVCQIDVPWKVFLFCDNGHKALEVPMYARWLKVGDVIGCHDWGVEIKAEDVEWALRGFEPLVPEMTEGVAGCKSRFWVCVEKSPFGAMLR